MAKLIGNQPNQVPTNGDLGDLAYQNKESVTIEKATLSSDGDNPLTLNRDTSNGDIVTLQKDGSGIGGIGVYDGDVTIYSSQSGHKGLRFGSGYIAPLDNTGAIADNSVDLGLSIARFSNLHLAGGVYLGGTGSANYLDDYEEGTWTPAFASVTATYNSQSGKYIKVGNLIHIEAYVDVASLDTTDGSVAKITTPFSSGSTKPTSIVVSTNNTSPLANIAGLVVHVESTSLRFCTSSSIWYKYNSSGVWNTSGKFYFAGSYYID